jgi:hypothetical protein
MRLMPDGSGPVTERRFVASVMPLHEAGTADDLIVDSLSDPDPIIIEGSFVMALWGWDVGADQGGGPGGGLFASGPTNALTRDVSTGSVTMERSSQQLYLSVMDGVVKLWPLAEPGLRLRVKHAHIDAQPGTHFVAVSQPQAADDPPIEGPASVQLKTVRGGPLIASWAEMGSSQAHGPKFSIADFAGSSLIWFMVIGGAVLLPGSAAAAVALRRRLEERAQERLEDAVELGHLEDALRLSAGLTSSRNFGEDARLLRLELLVRSGSLAEAALMLETMDEGHHPASRAAIELIRAHVQALSHDHDAAAQSIARCIGASAEFYDDVLENPVLAIARQRPVARLAIAAVTRGPAG